ncbi:DUF3168 domain-containing protein [Alcanivorax sp. IL3]|uniref:DUF3168 domain-containing protein n=1 Tax=unclassified Alcanivorax TaxID=2638842 RepID=UPI0039C0DE5F
MYPPVFPILNGNAAVVALLGSPVRVYPFGQAPQDVTGPYAAWQLITGSPENYLKDRPDADNFDIQMDIYAADEDDSLAVGKAIRNALEPFAYITRWGGQGMDPDTKRWRVSFDVSFIVRRV